MKIWVAFLVLSVFGICTGRFVSFTGEKFGDKIMHDIGDLCAYLMVGTVCCGDIKGSYCC